MALNDLADREVDAVERPERPIPSGLVSPAAALAIASGLTLAGLALAVAARGRRGLVVAVPLAGVVWGYDLALKQTAAGPAAMAVARALDVLAGAGPGGTGRALAAAAVVGLHTASVTGLSRYEVSGAPRSVPGAALVMSAMATTATAAVAGRHGSRRRDRAACALFSAVYAGSCGRAQWTAVRSPSAPQVRRAVAAGIHGLMPLQAALTAAAGSVPAALPIAAALPLARWLGRKVSPT
jgi:4-hydroxybenzoate polyprenyltransferase